MLRIDGLDVSIGSVSILRNVNIDVPAGQFTGLIGRNGAGKTTLMRTHHGDPASRNGADHFDERTLDRAAYAHARARLGIGYMPEDRRLMPGAHGRRERAAAGLGVRCRATPRAAGKSLRDDS